MRLANDMNQEELDARPALRQQQAAQDERAASQEARALETHEQSLTDADTNRWLAWIKIAAPALQSGDDEAAVAAAVKMGIGEPPPEALEHARAMIPELKKADPIVVGEGSALVSDEGQEIYKNTKPGDDRQWAFEKISGKHVAIAKDDPTVRVELGDVVSSTEWTSPQQGVNPETDSPGFFQTNKGTGGVRWVDASPMPASASTNVRQQKIDSLVAQGIPKTKADAIVDGHITIKYSEATGQILMTDVRDGTAQEIMPDQLPRPDRALPQPGNTLYDMALLATGPESAFKASAAYPLAWMGVEHDDKVVYARQALRIATREFVQTMSLNPRYPMGEQDIIRKDIAALPQLIDSPPLMQDRMRSLGDALRFRLLKVKEDARDTSLVAEHRKEARRAAATIENFLDLLGAPSGMSMDTDSGLPPDKHARMMELRTKKAEGTLDAID
jgi:hypothetical protein